MSKPGDILDRVRSSCAAVAAASTHVVINHDHMPAFVEALDLTPPEPDPGQHRVGDDESTAAFVMSLDSINFGSGYFPYMRKRPGMSGYHTVASSLRDLVADTGALTTGRLSEMTVDDCAATFGQLLDGEPAHELMERFAEAWHDLAAFVDRVGNGSFVETIAAADGSAARLVELLDEMPFFHDVHSHPVGEVLLYKRAQITAYDLSVAFSGKGPGQFQDLPRLTMFADNLVPHVLRVDGLLTFADQLLTRIDAAEDIPVGSVEEVEIRACGLHVVELLVDEIADQGTRITAGRLDNVLWNLGAADRYKSVPRHRSRCVFY